MSAVLEVCTEVPCKPKEGMGEWWGTGDMPPWAESGRIWQESSWWIKGEVGKASWRQGGKPIMFTGLEPQTTWFIQKISRSSVLGAEG